MAQGDYRKVLGYLEPYRNINMTTVEAGIISEIYVAEGSYVEQGAPVISLDHSVLKAQLRVAEIQANSNANIAVATADYTIANDKYNKLLEKSRSTTQMERQRAAAEVKKAEARMQMAKEEQAIATHRMAEIQAQIERRILRSPINGIVLEVNRDVAESASVSEKPGEKEAALVRVAQLDKLLLVVHLPDDSIGSLKTGDSIQVMVLKENSLIADRDGAIISGTIDFMSPDVDPSSETRRTKIVIDNNSQQYRSGSHAYALLPKVGRQY